MNTAKLEFAEAIADYVSTHPSFDDMDKKQAVICAVGVLTDDIGAANSFLKVIGLTDIDLYTRNFTTTLEKMSVTPEEILKLSSSSTKKGFVIGVVVTAFAARKIYIHYNEKKARHE